MSAHGIPSHQHYPAHPVNLVVAQVRPYSDDLCSLDRWDTLPPHPSPSQKSSQKRKRKAQQRNLPNPLTYPSKTSYPRHDSKCDCDRRTPPPHNGEHRSKSTHMPPFTDLVPGRACRLLTDRVYQEGMLHLTRLCNAAAMAVLVDYRVCRARQNADRYWPQALDAHSRLSGAIVSKGC